MKLFEDYILEMSDSERKGMVSLTAQIIHHKLKLDHAPENAKRENTKKWTGEITEHQDRLHALIVKHSHLKNKFAGELENAHDAGFKHAKKAFPNHPFPADRRYTRSEILLPKTEKLFRPTKQ